LAEPALQCGTLPRHPCVPSWESRAEAWGRPRNGALKAGVAGAQAVAQAPGLASMLDLDGDRNLLDDILQVVGRAKR